MLNDCNELEEKIVRLRELARMCRYSATEVWLSAYIANLELQLAERKTELKPGQVDRERLDIEPDKRLGECEKSRQNSKGF